MMGLWLLEPLGASHLAQQLSHVIKLNIYEFEQVFGSEHPVPSITSK